MPIVRVENDPHFKVKDSVADGDSNTLANFFAGQAIVQDNANAQSA